MSHTDFSAAAGKPPIYNGFGAGIRALNRTIVSEYQRPFVGGRAYAKPGGLHARPFDTPKIYAAVIHGMSVGGGVAGPLFDILAGRKDLEGSLYMGTAGFMNLSHIGLTRPGAAVLYDINPIQTWFWNYTLPLIARAKNAEDFLDTLVARAQNVQHNVSRLFRLTGQRGIVGMEMNKGMPPEDYIQFSYIGSPLTQWRYHRNSLCFHWTRQPEAFAHIQDMARRDAIGAITLDILDKAAWGQLAGHLAARPAGAPEKASLFFISNILEFLSHGADYTYREDSNATPAFAREAVSQILPARGYGIITDECDPAMAWPRHTEAVRPQAPSRGGPAAF